LTSQRENLLQNNIFAGALETKKNAFYYIDICGLNFETCHGRN
jgi:hypothetical protein